MEIPESDLIEQVAELRRAMWRLLTELKRVIPKMQAGEAIPADDLLEAMMNAERKLLDSSR